MTRIVKTAVSPALIVPLPTFCRVTSAQFTVTVAVDESLPSLEVPTLAVFMTTPQSSASVGATT